MPCYNVIVPNDLVQLKQTGGRKDELDYVNCRGTRDRIFCLSDGRQQERRSKNHGTNPQEREGQKIAGVCGGIAEYLNADPTIIRLAFALMVLGWGTGVLAYIACALILPEGDSEDTEEE